MSRLWGRRFGLPGQFHRFAGQAKAPALPLLALLLTGCGYIGEPQPPLANVPAKVADLSAVQRGGRIIVQFTVPVLTTEGMKIKDPLKLDLRIGTSGEPFDAGKWAAGATAIPEGESQNGFAHYEIPTAEWTGKEAIIGVRAISARGKDVGWSNFAIVPVVPAPERPSAVTAAATAGGVHLTWSAKGPAFRVFRKTAEASDFALAATVEKPEWTDAAAEFGKPYAYLVQTVVALGNHKEAQSDLSEEAKITPVDTFAPAVPTGLTASAAANSIELVWNQNTEPDLAGYRVYRAAGGGAFEKVADVSQIPAYSDKSVERGKTYRYQLSAFDQVGNESGRSAAIEASLH